MMKTVYDVRLSVSSLIFIVSIYNVINRGNHLEVISYNNGQFVAGMTHISLSTPFLPSLQILISYYSQFRFFSTRDLTLQYHEYFADDFTVVRRNDILKLNSFPAIRGSSTQFENRIITRVYIRSITRSTMYVSL